MAMTLKAVTSCIGYQQITSLSAATGLTVPAVDKNGNKQQPTFALIIAESKDVRWRDDGTDPTASVGMPMTVGVPLQYDGDLTRIKFIETAASAKLNISYYA
jgi:hypothetical protein